MASKDIIFFSAVAIVLLFVWFFIWPAVQNIEELRETQTQDRDDLQILQNTQNSVQEFLGFFGSLTEEEKRLVDLAAPKGVGKADLAILMNNIAQNNGVVINSISITEGAGSANGLTAAKISLLVEGNYPSLKAFIGGLEQTLRIFNIDSLSISAVPDGLDRYDISGKVYYID